MAVPFKKDPVEFNGRKLLAENVFDLLEKDDGCFIYEDIFAQIDTKSIEEKYSMADQYAYHPRQVTAILIYAYSQGVFSSRKIEKRCKKDLSFMYISHRNCPNFRVLSDFRKDNYKFFKDTFKKSVKIASGLRMISLGHVGIDGSKFNASTSKHKAASYSHLKVNEEKLKRKIEELLRKAENTDKKEDKIYYNGEGYSIPDDIKIKEDRLKKVKKELEEREVRENPDKKIYAKRKIIVEPVFGQIKTGGFRRFSLRGFKKAGGEFSLVCAVSNFKKIVNTIKAQIGYPKERELMLAAT